MRFSTSLKYFDLIGKISENQGMIFEHNFIVSATITQCSARFILLYEQFSGQSYKSCG